MMAQPVGLVFQLIKIIILIRSNVFVRSVCLKDVLTFYYKNEACYFGKNDAAKYFNDKTTKCQINCTIVSLSPSYNEMDENKWYEIEKLEIMFLSTPYTFVMEKSCRRYELFDVDVTIHCEGKYLKDRGIGESCVISNQCIGVTVNSTCNETTWVCQCKAGHLYLSESNTCSPEQGLGGQCSDTRQCKRVNQYSMCSDDNKCDCINGYTKMNYTCMPERRLNETCDDDIQCSVVTPNSTCNKTRKVCECTEGHLEMLNMCVHGRLLMKGIFHHCKKASLSIGNLEDKYMKQICSMYSEASPSTFEAEAENSSPGVVISVGIVGLVIGIAICGAVHFIVIRHRTRSNKRPNTAKEEINQPRSVEVSNAVYSEPIKHKNNKCKTGIAVENVIYNHLHEDPSEVCIQADYDHVPQLGTEDDDYSHLGTCNATGVDSPEEYGVVN